MPFVLPNLSVKFCAWIDLLSVYKVCKSHKAATHRLNKPSYLHNEEKLHVWGTLTKNKKNYFILLSLYSSDSECKSNGRVIVLDTFFKMSQILLSVLLKNAYGYWKLMGMKMVATSNTF